MDLDTSERNWLRQYLMKRFDLHEFKTLAFDIGVDYHLFPHEQKGTFSLELISFCERHNKLDLLIAEVLKQRPDDNLVQILTQSDVATHSSINDQFNQLQKNSEQPKLVEGKAELSNLKGKNIRAKEIKGAHGYEATKGEAKVSYLKAEEDIEIDKIIGLDRTDL